MLKLIEKFITQLGISRSKIKIRTMTNAASAISEMGFEACLGAAAKLHPSFVNSKSVLKY